MICSINYKYGVKYKIYYILIQYCQLSIFYYSRAYTYSLAARSSNLNSQHSGESMFRSKHRLCFSLRIFDRELIIKSSLHNKCRLLYLHIQSDWFRNSAYFFQSYISQVDSSGRAAVSHIEFKSSVRIISVLHFKFKFIILSFCRDTERGILEVSYPACIRC